MKEPLIIPPNSVLAHLIHHRQHGYYHRLPEGWRCSCGCGHLLTDEQMKVLTPDDICVKKET